MINTKIFILLVFFNWLFVCGTSAQNLNDNQIENTNDFEIVDEKDKTNVNKEQSNSSQDLPSNGQPRLEVIRERNDNIIEVWSPKQLNVKVIEFEEFIKLVSKNNNDILAKKHGFEASQANLEKEKDIFEPQFVASYQEGETHIRYSQSEAFSMFRSEKDEETRQYQARIESKIPSGASVTLGYTLNATKDKTSEAHEEYSSNLGFEITQPLLKNGGMTVRAGILIAEKEVDLAFQAYRQEMMQTMFEAITSSFDLYEAWGKYTIQKNSVEIAERILNDNKIRFRLGRMAQTEVLEAEAGLLERKSLAIKARQDVDVAMSNIRTFIADTNASNNIMIDVRQFLERKQNELSHEESLKKAVLYRPDYQLAKLKAEQENIRIVYAKNQRWPLLDLKGSYGLNGIGEGSAQAWDSLISDDYHSWTIGLELSFPLYGGLYSKNELLKAELQKKQALNELKAVEVNLSNLIHSAIRDVQNARKQHEYYRQAEELNKKLMDIELAKYKAGQSNSRLLLDKEKQLNLIKESNLAIQMYHQKAISKLKFAEGLILGEYDVESKKVEK